MTKSTPNGSLPKLLGTAEQKEVLRNMESWLAGTLQEGRWIDGLSLKAASKRYGVCISVIPGSSDVGELPMRFGQLRSGKARIFLLLTEGHYQLAKLKHGKQWPEGWIKAQEAAMNPGCGGLGPTQQKQGVCHSQHSWRPAHTPKPGKTRRSAAKSVRRTVSKVSHPGSSENTWRAPGTPVWQGKAKSATLRCLLM